MNPVNKDDRDVQATSEPTDAQVSELTTSERINRFFTRELTDDDIQDLSRRVSTIIVEVGGKQLLSQPKFDNRHVLADSLNSYYFDLFRSSLHHSSPTQQITPLLFIPWAYPESVFPLGYDEIRYAEQPVQDPTVSDSAAGIIKVWEGNALNDSALPELFVKMLYKTFQLVQYRSPDGVWHDYEGLIDGVLPGQAEDDHSEREWADLLSSSWSHRILNQEIATENVLALPALHLPPGFGDSPLHTYTKCLMRELQRNSKSIHELHWRTLEEIVAELLFDLGLEVTLTDRSNDGGRDVIARGELIPGEPMLLAVEVKHRPVVPVSELRQAMWANRHFPALLFVTSGRFSAGVFKERRQNEGRMRLYLKDGAGLSQWISTYVRRNFKD